MVKSDFDVLSNTILSTARGLLNLASQFIPFGYTIDTHGELAQVVAQTGKSRPSQMDFLSLLYESFAEQAARGEIRAIGVCVSTRIRLPNTGQESNAFCAMMENIDGEAIEVYLPYTIARGTGRVDFGNTIRVDGKLVVF